MDEFLNEDEALPFSKVELTYYEGDDVLADERDQPVGDDLIAGMAFKQHWGYETKDPNVVYIRNNRLKIDMCITKMEVSFAQHVYGIGPEG